MTNFWSCHLIISRKLPDDRWHTFNFKDADSLCWGATSILFLKWTPTANANIILPIRLILGKTVNYFCHYCVYLYSTF